MERSNTWEGVSGQERGEGIRKRTKMEGEEGGEEYQDYE